MVRILIQFSPLAMKSNFHRKGESWRRGKGLPFWKGSPQRGRDEKQKSLFPWNWSHDEIAQALKICEDDIENLLAKLPKKLPDGYTWGRYWKNFNLDTNGDPKDIVKKVTVNWKTIEVNIWWQYDVKWNLDTTIYTIYP